MTSGNSTRLNSRRNKSRTCCPLLRGRDARGPVMEIRVPPSLETARVTWLDAREQDLEKLFGIREGVPDLTGLVLNDVSSVGGASLQAIALAIAARTYGILTDRLQ